MNSHNNIIDKLKILLQAHFDPSGVMTHIQKERDEGDDGLVVARAPVTLAEFSVGRKTRSIKKGLLVLSEGT